jgi:hypothetical protein
MSKLWGNYPPIAGAAGAPTDAQYVVLALNGALTAERVLTAGRWMLQTDAGANGTLTYNYFPHRDYVNVVDEFAFGQAVDGKIGELHWD